MKGTDGSSDNLKERLKQQVEKGEVSISSEDIAAFEKKKEPVGETRGNTKAKVPKEAVNDPVMRQADNGDSGEAVNDSTKRTEDLSNAMGTMAFDSEGYVDEDIELTEEERNVFIASLVSGERYVRPFSLFGGNITGKFRCRTQPESLAMIGQLNREVTDKSISNALEYSTRLRNILLAAQVGAIEAEDYPVFKEPLNPVVHDDEVTDPPGWLGLVDVWTNKAEGLVSAVYNELKQFEKKYWTMVRHADDQDFWKPAESTSE